MTDSSRMLTAVDVSLPVDDNELAEAIDALLSCHSAAVTCGDACLSEHIDDMRACIRACVVAADLCLVTGRVLARTGGYDLPVVRNLLEATAKATATCAELCEVHAEHHKHCRLCADACRRAEQGAQRLLTSLAANVV